MSRINLLALGGMDEKNKSLYTIEIDSKIYIIDAGIYEPLRDDFGIQHFTPKLDFLAENRDKVKAILLSSLNRQQIGAISDVVRTIPNILICASDVTIFAIKQYFAQASNWNFKQLNANQETMVENQAIIPIAVSAPMPGSLGFVFKTKDGNIIYLSDYFNGGINEFNVESPIKTLEKLVNDKTLLLMSDSLNASLDADISSRFRIKKYIEKEFSSRKERIVASIYEDEIINIVELLELCSKYNRKALIYDKTMFNLLTFMMQNKNFAQYNIAQFDPNASTENTLVVVTGTRTDLYKKLQNILIAEEGLTITKEDIVFLGSPPQPGNEHIYSSIANDLSRIEPFIVETPSREKLSIHPAKSDLKSLLESIRPQYLMPVRGYYKEFLSSALLAQSIGFNERNILMAENGEVFTIENSSSQGLTRKVKEIGNSIIQLATEGGIELDVIKDRETLGSEGVVTIGFLVDKQTKAIKSNIDIQMRGVIWIRTQDTLMQEINNIIEDQVDIVKDDWIMNKLESKISEEVTKLLKANIKKAPAIVIRVYEV